jgi:hypothetical protein
MVVIQGRRQLGACFRPTLGGAESGRSWRTLELEVLCECGGGPAFTVVVLAATITLRIIIWLRCQTKFACPPRVRQYSIYLWVHIPVYGPSAHFHQRSIGA